MLTSITYQSTNQIYAFNQGPRSVGQIGQFRKNSYIFLLEKNFGNPRRLIYKSNYNLVGASSIYFEMLGER